MIRSLTLMLILLAAPAAGLCQESLVGTYRMISHVSEVDGVPTEPYGKSPLGQLSISKSRVTAFYTGSDREFGTTHPKKAGLYESMAGWAGQYRLEGKKLIIHIINSWVHHWNNNYQVRKFQLSGNRLTLTSDPMPFARDPSKTVVVRQVWEKVE